MKEYASNQRKKIVLKINKVKNKEILALNMILVLEHIIIENTIRNLFYYKT